MLLIADAYSLLQQQLTRWHEAAHGPGPVLHHTGVAIGIHGELLLTWIQPLRGTCDLREEEHCTCIQHLVNTSHAHGTPSLASNTYDLDVNIFETLCLARYQHGAASHDYRGDVAPCFAYGSHNNCRRYRHRHIHL